MYTIRINCTSLNDLGFIHQGKSIKINKKNYKFIHTCSDMYIPSLLYKKLNNFTTKTLEFNFYNELTENEFIDFITKMTDSGFISTNTNTIQYIQQDGDGFKIIYNYSFSIKPIKLELKYISRKKNRSTYTRQFL